MTCSAVVVGGGPAGYDCACELAQRGVAATLVESAELGGTCLNRGCIPTKLLLCATSAVEELAAQKKLKVLDGEISVNLPALRARSDKLLGATRKAMDKRLGDLGVRRVAGAARLDGPGAVLVGGERIEADHIVLATGCRPFAFPGLEPDGDAVLDSTGFLQLDEAPGSLIVLGAGFIGLEMAQIAHRMGARVTLLDAMDRIAPAEDPEVSKALHGVFKRQKWDIRLGVRAASLATRGGKAVLVLQDGTSLEADKALVAVGRRPETGGLGLETVGIAPDKGGFVPTDDHLRAAPGVFALGDLNGRMQLAHAASHQAGYAARVIAGETDAPYAHGPIPSILYGAPEVVRVGRMEHELAAVGQECRTTQVPLAANPIAQAHAATAGFVKAVWQSGRVVGVTAVGAEVSRLATAASMIVQEGWTAEQAHDAIFAHPTLDESLLSALRAG